MGQSMQAPRSILLAGALTALLLVIGVSAFAIWWSARNSQERVAALQEAHMEAGIALAAIRANVYTKRDLDSRLFARSRIRPTRKQYIDQFKQHPG